MSKHKFDLNTEVQRGRQMSCFLAAISLLMLMSAMSFLNLTVQAADGTFSLGGEAEITTSTAPHPKAVQLTSVCTRNCLRGQPFGELLTASVIYMPNHTLLFGQLHTLSTDYRRVRGDCGGGSPRFEIALDKYPYDGKIDGSVFVYIGPLYDFVNCPQGWQSTGDLIEGQGEVRWDLTQFGGKFYDLYYSALSLGLADAQICYILLVEDGAWFPHLVYTPPNENYQVFHFDNVRVNNDVLAVNQTNSLNLAPPQIPTLARQQLEQYITGRSGPRDLFGFGSYYGRRYSWTNIFRSGDSSLQRRGLQNRANISITPRQ